MDYPDYTEEGGKDADNGIYRPPHLNSKDDQDEIENYSYWNGWRKRRLELGDKFKWAE